MNCCGRGRQKYIKEIIYTGLSVLYHLKPFTALHCREIKLLYHLCTCQRHQTPLKKQQFPASLFVLWLPREERELPPSSAKSN